MEKFAELAETHSAVVFCVGDYAYKLKKPVNLGFLDFSSPEARGHACHRETELNRRFAPDVYLGVADVHGPAGQTCDYLVLMRRMPASRCLSALIHAGEPVESALRQVARILAVQHASAVHSADIDVEGTRNAVRCRWEKNLSELSQVRGEVIEQNEINEARDLAERFLAGRSPLFNARISAGRIVDGHGDLLAGDIFCLADGPRILDCLEFDDRLRRLDGVDDAAMLAMDLERLGSSALARQFVSWYLEYSGDTAPSSLRHHYVAYRALVRAKVGCLQARQGDADAAGQARQTAAIALRHLHAGAVTLVLVGGLPGTGKSTLAGRIADRLGFALLSSDRTRKELAGLAADQRAGTVYGTGIYGEPWTDRTYSELLCRASELLASGESVVLDASWMSSHRRQAAAAIAKETSSDLIQLNCTAASSVTNDRISGRPGSSDADPAVAAAMARGWDPWPEATVIETDLRSEDETEQLAVARIRPYGPEHVWHPARPYMTPG